MGNLEMKRRFATVEIRFAFRGKQKGIGTRSVGSRRKRGESLEKVRN
jgi:hypothetical protein